MRTLDDDTALRVWVSVHVRVPMMVSTLRPLGEARWGRCQATEAACCRASSSSSALALLPCALQPIQL